MENEKSVGELYGAIIFSIPTEKYFSVAKISVYLYLVMYLKKYLLGFENLQVLLYLEIYLLMNAGCPIQFPSFVFVHFILIMSPTTFPCFLVN